MGVSCNLVHTLSSPPCLVNVLGWMTMPVILAFPQMSPFLEGWKRIGDVKENVFGTGLISGHGVHSTLGCMEAVLAQRLEVGSIKWGQMEDGEVIVIISARCLPRGTSMMMEGELCGSGAGLVTSQCSSILLPLSLILVSEVSAHVPWRTHRWWLENWLVAICYFIFFHLLSPDKILFLLLLFHLSNCCRCHHIWDDQEQRCPWDHQTVERYTTSWILCQSLFWAPWWPISFGGSLYLW